MTMIASKQVSSSPARVLVTDGNERAALAVTRALGQAGIPVIVAAETETPLGRASRYCAGTWRYPSPSSQPEMFVESIQQAMQLHDIDSIISVTDSTTQLLVEHKHDLGRAGSTIPSSASYNLVSDKYRLMQLAKQLDVPIPSSIFVPDGNVRSVVEWIRQYPVVVKPGRSLLRTESTWIKTGVHIVASERELIDLYQRTPYLRHPSLIQERIEGTGEGVFGLFDRGRPCALFAHRRIREKPPAGGVSVLRESIALPKPMTDYAVRLLEHVKWNGVAMVEFKIDRRTGTPMLMEINGRFWGSLQLAMDAGLNFPYMLYQKAHGIQVVRSFDSYRVGTKSRWLLGDFDHLLMMFTKSKSDLNLSRSAPSRWRCLLDFIKVYQRDLHYEIERWDDLGPAWVEYRSWLGQVLTRGA
jgi:predicted ATP-grasp superfamily ATP-dependent carboligase